MPVDEGLNQRMRDVFVAHAGISEKRMMGGMCFFMNGHMLCGARRHQDDVGRFMFRVGKENETAALGDPTAQAVVHGNRKLGGFVHVDADVCDEAALRRWLQLCLAHAASLPAKI